MSGQALNLPTCACLLLRVPGTPDDAVRPYTDPNPNPNPTPDPKPTLILAPNPSPNPHQVRPYTPISEEAKLGSFDLLVKRYPEGAASQYLHELSVGDAVGHTVT